MKKIIKKIGTSVRCQKKLPQMIFSVTIIVFIGIIGFHLFKARMIKRFFAHYEPPPVSVSSFIAQEKTWHPTIEAVGHFRSRNGVDLTSQASGNVMAIHFHSGQWIEKDQALIDIDDRIEQAALSFNQAQLVLAKLNFQRHTNLYEKGAGPISSADEAKAKLQQAQSEVKRIQTLIQQKHITAPFSGKLGIRNINLGQYIAPGQTTIVSLQALDPLYLEFHVPEQFMTHLHPNQKIQFEVEAFPNQIFQGKINAINAKIDPNTHNILVQATAPNCPGQTLSNLKQADWIKTRRTLSNKKIIIQCDSANNAQHHVSEFAFIPGMFAAVKIIEPIKHHSILLPSTAISYSLYGNSVFIIEKDQDGKKDEKGKDILRAKRVFVKTGIQQGGWTAITAGLKPGQMIVSIGEIKLQNGARVTINNQVPLAAATSKKHFG